MKKILIMGLLIAALSFVKVFASEIPEFIEIGLNSSSLSESVTIKSQGGLYTMSDFAAPEEVSEEAEEGESSYYIGDEVSVTVSSSGTIVCNGADSGEERVDIYKTSEFLTCQNRTYRGSVSLRVSHGKILIVNILVLDEYLYGVVGREMSDYFPIEALKAQSVAARNYAIISLGRHKDQGFDLCNGEHCQAYGGVDYEGENVRRAVDETTGKLLYYEGEVVQCYYYSSNGGFTENSENVWYAPLGYLRGKSDPFEKGDEIPGYNWSHTFTAKEIEDCLSGRGVDIGDILDVSVVEYSDNQHAMEVLITGTKGEKSYYKDNIRAAFPERLKSTLFTLSKGSELVSVKVLTGDGMAVYQTKPVTVMSGSGIHKIKASGKSGEYTFTGSGNGHGVGMSQYGAKAMAEDGYTYEEILKFYFTDTEILD